MVFLYLSQHCFSFKSMNTKEKQSYKNGTSWHFILKQISFRLILHAGRMWMAWKEENEITTTVFLSELRWWPIAIVPTRDRERCPWRLPDPLKNSPLGMTSCCYHCHDLVTMTTELQTGAATSCHHHHHHHHHSTWPHLSMTIITLQLDQPPWLSNFNLKHLNLDSSSYKP